MKGGTFMVPTPQKYVESALRYVGYARYTTGFLPHALMQFVLQFMHFVAPSLTEKIVIKRMRLARVRLFKQTK